MQNVIELSPNIYQLLERRARQMRSTPAQVAETAIQLQLGGTTHIEMRSTRSGLQAYLRGTRVAVRHIAAFWRAGQSAEEIHEEMPHISPAAIYEAIAYFHDHQDEIDNELAANTAEVVYAELKSHLAPHQFTLLTGQPL